MKRIGTFIESHASAGSWGAEWTDRNFAIIEKKEGFFLLKENGLVPFSFPEDSEYGDPCGNPRDRNKTYLNDGETAIKSEITTNGKTTLYHYENGRVVSLKIVVEKSSDKKIIIKHETENSSSIVDEYYEVPSSCYCVHHDGYISSHGKRDRDYRIDERAVDWVKQHLPNCPFFVFA